MLHEIVGIWAISCIIKRRNLLLRLNNPPHDPSNPFTPLPTHRPVDMLDWYERRYAEMEKQNDRLIYNDLNYRPTNTLDNFLTQMEPAHLRKLKDYIQNLFV